MEIAIVAAERIGVAAFGSLHYIEVVGIAQGCMVRMMKHHRLAHFLQELRIVVSSSSVRA